MTSELLSRARDYETARLPLTPAALLPLYHVTGGTGWINDPNGFSLYRGEYHLFYQYNPYDVHWSSMHWGHVKTRDFIRWERLPCAMAPDMPYDRDGCFSGSALALDDGRHLLMYTGVRKEHGPDGQEREYQTQCLAFGDGVDYEKYTGNPVIGADALPEGGSARDFRDPKIWRGDGRYFCVAGNRCPDGSGAVLLFESGDALRWRFRATLAASENRYGRMWECPDFFALNGRQVLLVSPQEMRASGCEFIEGNVTLCLIGAYDRETAAFRPEHEQTIDYGLDFYAPQTLAAADGRRIMIAWMQYWNSVDRVPEGYPFFGQMTVPRELSVRDGRLIQTPVRELETYRGALSSHRRVTLSETPAALPGIEGRCLDMTVTVRPGPDCRAFRMDLAAGGGFETTVLYTPGDGILRADRSRSGGAPDIVNERLFSAPMKNGALKLRVLLDRCSLELFVNDGEKAASFTLYTPAASRGIFFSAQGGAEMDAEKYDLVFDENEKI